MTKHISTNFSATAPLGGDDANLTDDYLRDIQEAILADLSGFPGNIWSYGVDNSCAGVSYAYTPSPVLDGYALGMQVVLRVADPAVASTGTAPTLAIGGLAAKTIKRLDGSALAIGDIVVGLNLLIYDGTNFLLTHSSAIDFVLDKEYSFAARQNWGVGTSTAAAADLTLPTDGNYIPITNSGAISVNGIRTTGTGAVPAGSVLFLKMVSAGTTLKHNTAPSANFDKFTIAGGADYVSKANDLVMVVGRGAGTNFDVYVLTLLDEDTMTSDSTVQGVTQQSVKTYVDALKGRLIPVAYETASLSPTELAVTTGLSSDISMIVVQYQFVNLSGTDVPQIEIGSASGYAATSVMMAKTTAHLSGPFALLDTGHASAISEGQVIFTKILSGSANDSWMGVGNTYRWGTSPEVMPLAGRVIVTGTTDRIKISASGSNTFDSGTISIYVANAGAL